MICPSFALPVHAQILIDNASEYFLYASSPNRKHVIDEIDDSVVFDYLAAICFSVGGSAVVEFLVGVPVVVLDVFHLRQH